MPSPEERRNTQEVTTAGSPEQARHKLANGADLGGFFEHLLTRTRDMDPDTLALASLLFEPGSEIGEKLASAALNRASSGRTYDSGDYLLVGLSSLFSSRDRLDLATQAGKRCSDEVDIDRCRMNIAINGFIRRGELEQAGEIVERISSSHERVTAAAALIQALAAKSPELALDELNRTIKFVDGVTRADEKFYRLVALGKSAHELLGKDHAAKLGRDLFKEAEAFLGSPPDKYRNEHLREVRAALDKRQLVL